MEAFTFEKKEKPAWADETVWLNIVLDGKVIGNLALLSKKTAMACDIRNVAVILFELDTTVLKPFTSRTNRFEHLPEYPLVDYDISFLFDSALTWDEIKTPLDREVAKNPLLHGASFVDEYRGKQIPEGKKSVTVRLVIGSLEKTLTSQEIEACATSVVNRLSKVLGADMRQL